MWQKALGEFVHYNRKLKHLSRVLRKNMTQSEIVLWSRLRRKQLKEKQFYRQKIIGEYIVDFYCPSSKLVVQLDGSQHLTEQGLKEDAVQDDYMKRIGLRVLRFWPAEVLSNTDGVVSEIYDSL